MRDRVRVNGGRGDVRRERALIGEAIRAAKWHLTRSTLPQVGRPRSRRGQSSRAGVAETALAMSAANVEVAGMLTAARRETDAGA